MHAGEGRPAHHVGFAGVDGEARAGLADQPLDDGHDTAKFLVGGDGIGTGPRRFAADIEQVGPFVVEAERVGDRLAGGGEATAVGETVGSAVTDDPHDAWAVQGEAGDGGAGLGESGQSQLEMIARGAAAGGFVPCFLRGDDAPVDGAICTPLEKFEGGKDNVLAVGDADDLIGRGVDAAGWLGQPAEGTDVAARDHVGLAGVRSGGWGGGGASVQPG